VREAFLLADQEAFKELYSHNPAQKQLKNKLKVLSKLASICMENKNRLIKWPNK